MAIPQRDIKRFPLPNNWREIHPTTYVCADDLIGDKGEYRVIPAVISKVELHEIENPKTYKKEKKLVAYFEKASKPMVLNATMNKVLQEMSRSRNPHDWVGLSVELYIERNVRTPQGSQDVPRIRPGKKGSSAKSAIPPDVIPLEVSEKVNLEDLSPEELEHLMEDVDPVPAP